MKSATKKDKELVHLNLGKLHSHFLLPYLTFFSKFGFITQTKAHYLLDYFITTIFLLFIV